MKSDVLPGSPYPLGATVREGGVNFAIFSKSCTAVELLLFDDVDARTPSRSIPFDPTANKTFYYWHAFVPKLKSGQLYGFRVHGPFEPKQGLRFDGEKVLIDPYARAVVTGQHYDRTAAIRPGDNCARAPRCVVVDGSDYDWEGDRQLVIPSTGTVIYELHVAGFTRHPSSGVAKPKRGTYSGLVEKIPYLKKLGITAVELLPVQQFDVQDAPPSLTNYWGYSPIAFFAPHNGYSSNTDPIGAVYEFRDMVKAMHRSGIEVILDVVFNHTSEGNHLGPALSFKGLENPAYYILEKDRARYANFSGCGNTVNGNYSIVSRLIQDCLRYWVAEMHVDGFRFDLASVLARGETGQLLENPPLLWAIESDPVLAGTKIIAEAWDAAGLYQVGSFIGDRFAEWNGQFRDDVRKFVRGDNNTVVKLSNRIIGSPDIYPDPDRQPDRSIHFVTCHDGFTLNDLVTYNTKRNSANGEGDTDGRDDNCGWNCGVEGPTDAEDIEALRLRQIKNLLAILLISQGTPMVLMGDEVRRTQQGNNNAYCQDNELSWFDWHAVEKQGGLLRFAAELIGFVQSYSIFQQERMLCTSEDLDEPSVTWHGVKLNAPDWKPESHTLALTLRHPQKSELLHVILNAYWEPLDFAIPALPPGQAWHCIVDTALPSPDDFSPPKRAPMVSGNSFRASARSSVILLAQDGR
jgi:isoamylase